MNKKEKLVSLTWECFWEQKRKEVGWFLIIAILFVFFPYAVGLINKQEHIVLTWLIGFWYLIAAVAVLVFLICVVGIWIENNWDKAKKRAKKKLKNTERRKKK